MAVRPRRISDFKPLLTNLAQTSHYEVQFGALPSAGGNALKRYLQKKGVDTRFIAESAGLLCYDAVLPTTSLGSVTIEGNYMGIQEKFAHTRIYDDITLSFYVDKNYQMLKFIEIWMEFISSGSFNNITLEGENPPINQNNDAFFIRMQYPAYYKLNSTRIVKFDRDYNREIEYNFRGLYPRGISSIPVTYMNSDTLKMTVTFSYDRYIMGKTNSINQFVIGDNNNQDPKQPQQTPSNSTTSLEDLLQQSKESYSFISQTGNNIQQSLSQQANSNIIISERRTV